MADIQVVLNQTLFAQQVRNVLHFFYGGTLDSDGRQDIADYIRSSWMASNFRSRQVENWSLDSVSIRACGSTGPYAEVPFTSGILAGTETSTQSTSQVALLVSLINSGLVAPTRGRIYFAGVSHASIGNDGLFQSITTADASTLVNSWIDATTADLQVLDLRIASRNPDGTCDVLNVVDNVIARSNPATQRRRRIGVGS